MPYVSRIPAPCQPRAPDAARRFLSRARAGEGEMQAVLFDIDGTLVRTNGAGRVALDRALAREFARREPVDVPVSGRTDRQIASSLFLHYGMDDTPHNWQRLQEAYLRELPDSLREHGGVVLPGVTELLQELAELGVVRGLLTGNMRDAAWIKLRHFDLADHFSFGGFGERHHDRDSVAREAFAELCSRLSREPPRDAVWVVGDTPLDIRCARAIGVRVAAVCTGTAEPDELAREGPDLLLHDLTEAAARLRAIA